MQHKSQHVNHYTKQVMIITASLAQDLVNLDFLGRDINNIVEGFWPFHVPCGDGDQRMATITNAQDFDLIESGKAGITLADLQMLKAKETNHILMTFIELETTVSMFGNFINVTLGPHHRSSQEYQCFWQEFQQLHMHLYREVQSFQPAHLLHHLQLQLFCYFDAKRFEQKLTTKISFVQILTDIERSAIVPPELLTSLTRLACMKSNAMQERIVSNKDKSAEPDEKDKNI